MSIDMAKVTKNMIEQVLIVNSIGVRYLNFEHSHIKELLNVNMEGFVALNPEIVKYVPANYVDEKYSLEYIKSNPNNGYNNLLMSTNIEYLKSENFMQKAILVGASFDIFPRNKMTKTILENIVKQDRNIIKRMPKRYVSDDLYILCVNVHKYTKEDVPQEYMTRKFVSSMIKINDKFFE